MTTSAFHGLGSLRCAFDIPESAASVADVLARWSDLHASLPALIVTPESEDDVAAAIDIAKRNNLQVLPTGGRHSTFVAVDGNSLVLDMRLFRSIKLDKEKGSVLIGGGVTTGELMRALASEGYYTPLPGSNAVGVIGALLGGGSTSFNGLHGYMADNALSFRIITATGQPVDVHCDSRAEELELFQTLCGAGHGLGVVTSAVMKVYPANALALTEGKIWTRTMIFPPPALPEVQKQFLDLHPIKKQLNAHVSFVRSPPNTPSPGAPLIVLSISYYGAAEDAERETRQLYEERVIRQAIKVETALVPLANANDSLEALNARGGLKSTNSARLAAVGGDALAKSFAEWVRATDRVEDGKRTAVVFHSFSPTAAVAAGKRMDGDGTFMECRDKGVTVTVSTWCSMESSNAELVNLGEEIVRILQQGDDGPARKLPNSRRLKEDLTQLYGQDRLARLRLVKKHWDGGNLFWTPYSGN